MTCDEQACWALALGVGRAVVERVKADEAEQAIVRPRKRARSAAAGAAPATTRARGAYAGGRSTSA